MRTEARSLFPSQHSSWRFWWFGRSRRLCSNSRHKAPQRTPRSKDKVWFMIMLTTITQQTKVSVSGVSQWCLDIFDYIWILMVAPEVVADIRKSFDLFVFSSTVELIQFCVRIVRWCFHYVWHASDSWGFFAKLSLSIVTEVRVTRTTPTISSMKDSMETVVLTSVYRYLGSFGRRHVGGLVQIPSWKYIGLRKAQRKNTWLLVSPFQQPGSNSEDIV